ncbi:DUF1223 domain-containing protein [Pelagibacterium lacus]|uniref:DUF1223 domain-containing protein n=1 Tax=Pelagibacterium lacus TaxID=2282655 RepID=A0A369W5M2_9HYPH|nr:DUF1223 domain-containing protein [Pelagibacterium lacus]RDE09643.1 DUF1223 domain-containing protein [Pelagibacterium lacus]
MITARFLPSRILLALSAAFAAAPATALDISQGDLTVLELFTSQGCSSCPEADRLLSRLGAREDIVALGYHIDYWDYIGWSDTFALPENSQLQRGYAESWGKNRLYTPQLVVNGRQAVVGSDAGEAEAAIAAATLPLDIAVSADGEDAVTLVAEGDPGHKAAIVWVITYRDAAEVVIERGENSGRVLSYSHIVTGRQPIGMWSPDEGARITIPLDEVMGETADGAAIVIQEKNGRLPGPILAATTIHR